MIPDSHVHLDLIDLETDKVVSQARSGGIYPIITIGISLASSMEALRIAESFESVYASAGIHPNDTAALVEEDFEKLEKIAGSSERVVAIGETGLDYYRDRSPVERQMDSFRRQIRLAKKMDTALVVHDRQAHSDVLEILDDENAGETRVIMHCFSGDAEMLRLCESRGYFISFAGPVTFRKSETARKAAALAKADRILVETDSPFLSPEPFRGRPNFPARVRLIADELARLRGVQIDEMERTLAANTKAAFGIELTGDR